MVNWTGEKDAQLLLGIFEYQNITFSKELLQHLANKIGEGCTPKAVSHRLNNIKARAKGAGSGDGSASSTPGTPASTTGTPRKGSPTKKKATPKTAGGYGDLGGHDELASTPTPNKGKKRGCLPNKMTADYDGQGQKKKVKTEYKTEIDELGGYGYGDSIEILGGGNNGTAADENDEKDMV